MTVLAAENFQPFFFLLPDSIGLLEYLLIVEFAWLVAMAIYGYALRRIVRNPRDSVVVFHRIFWRIFVYPKKTSLLEAYEAPMSVAALEDFDTPMLDVPSYGSWSDTPGPQAVRDMNADTAGGSAVGVRSAGGTSAGGGMVGLDADVDFLADDAGPPPEPEPMALGDSGEIEINVELQANAPKLAIGGMVGDTLTVHVPCGAEDGIANRHVVHALCHVLGLESYQITLLRGHTRGQKTFRLTGISLQKVQQKVMAIAP